MRHRSPRNSGTRFHIVNRVRAITPKLCPANSKNSRRALSITPVRPVRPSVGPSVHPYVPLCVQAITPKPNGIYSGNYECMHRIDTMCHEQGRQLLIFAF